MDVQSERPVVRKRRKVATAESYSPGADLTNTDAVNLDRIRNGLWRDVLQELGSVEYNRLAKVVRIK